MDGVIYSVDLQQATEPLFNALVMGDCIETLHEINSNCVAYLLLRAFL